MLIHLLTYLFSVSTITAQGWAARLDGIGVDYVAGLASDSVGSVYVVGYYSSSALYIYNSAGLQVASLPNNGGNDAFVVKYAFNGTFLWAARLAGSGSDQAVAVAIDSLDNVVLSGFHSSAPLQIYNAQGVPVKSLTNAGVDCAYVVKYSSTGQFMWAARQDGTGSDSSAGVTVDSFNNVLVAGYYTSPSFKVYDLLNNVGTTLALSGSQGAFVAKYDTNGSFVWAARQDGLLTDAAYSVSTDSTGNVYVGGSFTSNPQVVYDSSGRTVANLGNSGTGAGSIVKYFSNGSFVWAARLSGNGQDLVNQLTVDVDGNLYVAGDFSSSPLSIYNAFGTVSGTLNQVGSGSSFLIKYFINGTFTWAARFSSTGSSVAWGVSVGVDGTVAVSGYYQTGALLVLNSTGSNQAILPGSGGGTSSFVVKLSNAGSFLWAARQDGLGNDQAYTLSVAFDGSIYVGGQYSSSSLIIYDSSGLNVTTQVVSGTQGGYVVKYNSDGSYFAAAATMTTTLTSTTTTLTTSSSFTTSTTLRTSSMTSTSVSTTSSTKTSTTAALTSTSASSSQTLTTSQSISTSTKPPTSTTALTTTSSTLTATLSMLSTTGSTNIVTPTSTVVVSTSLFSTTSSYLGGVSTSFAQAAQVTTLTILSTTSLVSTTSLTSTLSVQPSSKNISSSTVVGSLSQYTGLVSTADTISSSFKITTVGQSDTLIASSQQQTQSEGLVLTLGLISQIQVSNSISSKPSSQTSLTDVTQLQVWVWAVVGAGALLLVTTGLTLCFCCRNKNVGKAQTQKVINDTSYQGGTTMLDQTIPLSDGTTMMSQTIPLSQTTTVTRQIPQSQAQQPNQESFTQAVPSDQGNEPYLSEDE